MLLSIDVQRILDARIFHIMVFGVICGIVGAIITAAILAIHRRMTVRELADNMFGELQREHTELLGLFSQAKMAIECLESKVSIARGQSAALVEGLEG